MSQLIKIHSDREEIISQLKIKLYLNGISSITKKSFQTYNNTGFSNDSSHVFELYIDNQHRDKASQIIKTTINTDLH